MESQFNMVNYELSQQQLDLSDYIAVSGYPLLGNRLERLQTMFMEYDSTKFLV